MNNQDQVAEVIRTWQKRHKNVMDSDPDWAAQNLAHDLHNAGLLVGDTHTRYSHINRESIIQWMKRNDWEVASSGVGGELWKSTTCDEAEVGVPCGPLDHFSIESISKRLARWGGVEQSVLLATLATVPKSPHPNPPIDVHKPAWEVTEIPDKWVSAFINKVWITDSHGWGKSMTTDQARNLAHALLAAANYSEE